MTNGLLARGLRIDLGQRQRYLDELLLVGHWGSTAYGMRSATLSGTYAWAKCSS